jgi:starch synthase (maltosyl-transferring)
VAKPPPRIRIESPQPAVDAGRYPAKRCVGDAVTVSADIFRDGHDVLRAVVRYAPVPGPPARRRRWKEAPLTHIDAHVKGDRWEGTFPVDRPGRWVFTIQAWVDPFAAWREELERKIAFGDQDLSSELAEGAMMLEAVAGEATVDHALATLRDSKTPAHAKYDAALGAELFAAMEARQPRHEATTMEPQLQLEVDRERARFSTWYELFPRSWGGLKGVAEQVPQLAELGFDVLYLPPIHPIGLKNRKGRNNAVKAAKQDPGSPWAIGHHQYGGHEALHPDLGTWEDFDGLVAAAREHDMDVALDFAIQCSADHPWLTEHPEWFNHRPDGTLKYAENPPKKYQDIYNVNWNCDDWRGLWDALLEIVRGWVDRGVTVFRVDNPHTKPFGFWEWLIEEIRRDNPDVLFLAEAFTRRKVMQHLAKTGFNQSYTYFTWKNARWELREYLEELALGPERDYFRPNFFVNTPDILTAYLVEGGPPAFYIRFLLASLLSPTYGIYSGFEHYENVPVAPGSEEYMDSEKYEIKQRALDGPMLPFIKRINAIRREYPALQRLGNLRFLDTENDALLAFAKDDIIAIINVDPHHAQEGVTVVPYELGLPPAFAVEDLLSGETFDWRLGRNYVRLDPAFRVGHVFAVKS